MRDERRLPEEGAECPYSEKLAWVEMGGSGEREREVDRELWADLVGRVGIWMVRDKRRDETPCEPQDVGALLAAFDCFRVRGASGNRMVEVAGLEPTTLEDTDELSGRSQGTVCCLRSEAGLIDVEDEACRPGDEDQWANAGGLPSSSVFARCLPC